MRELRDIKPEIFFLTYDEPLKDQYWERLLQLVPWAQRVDGVKGFDAAHKTCAQLSRGRRIYIIDGDNSIESQFLNLRRPFVAPLSDTVLSWASKNSINGLVYGNGGIKNWSRSTLLKMKSHESAGSTEMAVDFCFGITYRQLPEVFSVSDVHQTPFQAFRAGFREGVKMSLINGARDATAMGKSFESRVPKSNLERLKIWCSIGADVTNGLWAIYGARLGCFKLTETDWDYRQIHDYEWFDNFWSDQIQPQFRGFQQQCAVTGYTWSDFKVAQAATALEHDLRDRLGLEVSLFSREASRLFKSLYLNRPRTKVLKTWS